MVRREVLDDFLRQRAKKNGATLINGLFIGVLFVFVAVSWVGRLGWIG